MPRAARAPAAVSPDPPVVEESASGSSAERSLRLLALLANEGRALTLAELAAQLGLPKGTAHRICTQLLATGFLARDVDERSFSVGPALRKLAFDTLNHGVVRGLRHEVLSELVRQGRRDLQPHDARRRAGAVPRPRRGAMAAAAHARCGLACAAALHRERQALSRADAEDARDVLIDSLPLVRMTANTITKADALRAECDQIARRGYSRDREEFIAGLVAVAVPVRDAAGEVRAALAVHAPTARMSMEDAVKRIDALKAAAERMSSLL
jgi:IclR family acetate operon transcriptional repressor